MVTYGFLLRNIHPELLTYYIAAFIGILAIATVWWWHVVRHNKPL